MINMRRALLTTLFALALLVFPVEAQVINGQNSPAAVQEQFIVQKKVYAFDGGALLCSFNATAGCRVELNLTSSGDYPYEIIFEIVSNIHGQIFNFSTYGDESTNFNQAVNLNYDDSYNITVTKHPFYSTVTINGIIDLYRIESINSTVPPTYLPSSSSPAPSPNTTSNTTPTPIPTASVPEFPSWIILPLFIVATLLAIVYVRKKTEKTAA